MRVVKKAARFSVIVPTYEREDQLGACLEGLASQTLALDDFEVIVVDDTGSTDLIHLAEAWTRLDLTVLPGAKGGPGSARNLGAANARGRFLAFTDDDCVPDPEWLERLDVLALVEGAIVGGTITNGLPSNAYATASYMVTLFAYQYYDGDPGRERFFTANNLALTREGFEELGGFESSIPARTAEDKDLCDRWRAKGGALVFVPGAQVEHAHFLKLPSFVRQHFQYGRGILCFRVLHRERQGGRRLVPEPWGFYTGLIAFPAKELGGLWGLRVSGLAVVSQVATALGALYASVFDLRRLPREAGSHRESRP